MPINSRLIAKNTAFLYVRLILVVLVTLYTSRVLLDKLGEVDYGLYNVVYSVIGMFAFLNGTLSTSTSRFITFALGTKDPDYLQKVFNTTLITHLFLAGIIVLLGETIGLWYAHHVMVVPPGRWDAAMIVFQVSIVSSVISILQVPFTSEVIAHEKMDAYAFVGIFEVVAKLSVVFLLSKSNADRLVFYAILTLIVSVVVCACYFIYCRKSFQEIVFSLQLDRKSFKEIVSFSSWNILAYVSNTLMGQGVIMLYNVFFAPVVVAAQAIANQVFTALSQFSWNVRNAVNPQIIKLYADGKYDESSRLTFVSAELLLFLTMFFCVPCILVMPTLLNIWLVDVPEHTLQFARLLVLQLILDSYGASFYAPMLAANKISKNSVIAAIMSAIQFAAIYLLFKSGLGPLWARYVCIISVVLFSFVIKPVILCRDIGYQPHQMIRSLLRGLLVMMIVGVVNGALFVLFPQNTIWQSALVVVLSVLSVLIAAVCFTEKDIRMRFYVFVKNRFR